MTIRNNPDLAEALEACRPVLPPKPNILKTLLVVSSPVFIFRPRM